MIEDAYLRYDDILVIFADVYFWKKIVYRRRYREYAMMNNFEIHVGPTCVGL